MEVILIVLIYFLLMSPTWLEAFVIDPVFWEAGKDDKPVSTYLRGGLMLLVSIGVDFPVHYSKWYWALGISITFHILMFAPLINLKLKRPIDYLGGNKYDQWIKGIPLWLRLVIAGILLIGAVLLFEHFKY